ncbi:hypothetical protein LJ753_16820 [Arthrobacter sp. zg-Y20]|uniref:DUF7302 family protein n=1 Tax=unclassified Arthrobacter TaxID=235627 RepID=UPI001D13994F|nr:MULTISPECIES: hypothetical protein [unclassified Arthrobacter]MCC3277529.1 hypothetical protein [Arthrobacter sp. zg-Y20]MDK1317687.1 hypothetical protein [Arthrobacter sp. zg.Y20]WIB07054.1 hypothetical protein QNO06_04820 [Arthrobacter sp. zg-Y20]
MPRFTNSVTGVVVNVDEVTAAQLGSEWAPAAGKAAPQKPQTKPKPRRKNT